MDHESPRVAVAVKPRLYADALVRALQNSGCQIVRLDDKRADVGAESCDIVIVSGDQTLAPSPAHMVIRLPDNSSAAEATVITDAGEVTVGNDIQAVIDLVAVHCRAAVTD